MLALSNIRYCLEIEKSIHTFLKESNVGVLDLCVTLKGEANGD